MFARLRNSQLWKSTFREPLPVDQPGRVTVGNFVLHLHPASIKEHALRPRFTWCMGGITFFLFLIETLTGVLLMFYYRPTIEWAYHDMLDLPTWYPSALSGKSTAGPPTQW